MHISKLLSLSVTLLFIASSATSSDQEEKNINREARSSPSSYSIQPIDLEPTNVEVPLKPGVYRSSSIELIFGHALRNFNEEDLVVSDIDEVLITGIDPYYFEHNQKNTDLNEQLFSLPQHKLDKFFLFLWAAKKWTLMESQLPELLSELQVKNIKLIANTALNPVVNHDRTLDLPSWRVDMLRDHFGIDFSDSFPETPCWDFDSLNGSHAGDLPPFFKQGIILSGDTPKHLSTLALLEKLLFKPRRVLYVDDRQENCLEMHHTLQSNGIECYSFVYTRSSIESPRSYISDVAYNEHLEIIEEFVGKLILGEDVDHLLSEAFNRS